MTATGLPETAAIDAVFGLQFASSSATHQYLHPLTSDSCAATCKRRLALLVFLREGE
jgi:hypothetical protein